MARARHGIPWFEAKWTAPELLSESQRERLAHAKIKAAKREKIESTIPTHLLYVKGWPVAMPTLEETSLIAQTRRRVAEVMEIEVHYTTALSVWQRYADLIRLKELKAQTKKHSRIATPTNPSLIAQNTPTGFLFVR